MRTTLLALAAPAQLPLSSTSTQVDLDWTRPTWCFCHSHFRPPRSAFSSRAWPRRLAHHWNLANRRKPFAWTVEPGEMGTPANLKEDSAAFAANVEHTFSATTAWPIKSSLFRKTAAWKNTLGWRWVRNRERTLTPLTCRFLVSAFRSRKQGQILTQAFFL